MEGKIFKKKKDTARQMNEPQRPKRRTLSSRGKNFHLLNQGREDSQGPGGEKAGPSTYQTRGSSIAKGGRTVVFPIPGRGCSRCQEKSPAKREGEPRASFREKMVGRRNFFIDWGRIS